MLRRKRSVSLFMAMILMVGVCVGCAKDRSVDPKPDGPKGTYLDEPIILSAAGPYLPVEVIVNGREFIFDLSEDSLVQSGRCNDFWISYLTGETCDYEVEVWDNGVAEWRNVSYGGAGCFGTPQRQHHMFSVFQLNVSSVLDSASRIRVRAGDFIGFPRIWALEVNPEYWRIPLSNETPYGAIDLANSSENGHFYTHVIGDLSIGEVDESGRILRRFRSPVDLILGMAFDGENMWVIGPPDTLFKVSLDGDILCAFSLPTTWSGDLTWDGERVWLSEPGGADALIWGFDPEASCALGDAVASDTIPRPGSGPNVNGLAWDGTHLLVIDQAYHMYRVQRDGLVVDTVVVSVEIGYGAVWDGSRICLVNFGPIGPEGRGDNESTIACFRLR